MRHIVTAAILASALALPAAAPAQEQTSSAFVRSNMITIDYVEPRDPRYLNVLSDDPAFAAANKTMTEEYQAYKAIAGRLQKRQLLEEFSQFLAPVRLPFTLRLRTKQCGYVNAFYTTDDWSINLCYEYVKHIEDDAPKATTPEGITRRDAIIGRVVGTLLHEGGHAISSLLRIPVLAREEDTADQIAAFVMLQFGTDVAKTMIKGEAYGWYLDDGAYIRRIGMCIRSRCSACTRISASRTASTPTRSTTSCASAGCRRRGRRTVRANTSRSSGPSGRRSCRMSTRSS